MPGLLLPICIGRSDERAARLRWSTTTGSAAASFEAPLDTAQGNEMRHHVATATTLDGLCDFRHVRYMFYRSRPL
jgi:hypothetical protein